MGLGMPTPHFSNPLSAFKDSPILVQPDGTVLPYSEWDPRHPTALLPGSFNPLHEGHRQLAQIARGILGMPLAFEISQTNVDKPPIPESEMTRRVAAFAGVGPVWVSRAPRFVEKCVWFPGATFVVGADTAARLISPLYYQGDTTRMLQALACIRSWECRFLVACRVDGLGKCWCLAGLPIPEAYREMFAAIPSDRFRLDISSTAIRSSELA